MSNLHTPIQRDGICRRRQRSMVLLLWFLLGLAGCGNQQDAGTMTGHASQDSVPANTGRWYTQAQADRGNRLYQINCAECHKPDASGTEDWQRLDANGKLPPPPLNGTAHTWHHPLSVLRRTVRLGGVPLGGSMPGFGDKLNGTQIDDILAWVQTHWSDEVYRIWYERNTQANRSLQAIEKG
ncbi:MAG: cytochrome c [Candidatus Thiodiazotropha sp.]